MKSISLLALAVALALVASSPARAQEGGAPPAAGGAEPAPEPSPPPPEKADGTADEAPITIAFLGVHAGPEDAETGFVVEERVRAALEAPPFALADAPSGPLPPDCLESDTCRLERIAAVGSPWVVVGTLGREERAGAQELVLTLHLIDRTTGQRAARASAWATAADQGAAGLLTSIEPVVQALVQTIDPGAPPAVPEDVDLGEAAARDDDDDDDDDIPEPEDETRTRMWPEEDEEGKGPDGAEAGKRLEAAAPPPAATTKAPAEASSGINYGAWIWSGSFVAAGTAAALLGVGFDLLSPTSVNDELDVFDAVGPGLVVVGATVALAGLVVNPFLWLDMTEDAAAEGGEPHAR